MLPGFHESCWNELGSVSNLMFLATIVDKAITGKGNASSERHLSVPMQ
jgi:hypothetical protein